jgi:hypothetical protein
MNLHRAIGLFLGLFLLMVLSACGTMSNQGVADGYWNNQHWDAQLLDAAQSSIHYPLDDTGQPIGDPTAAKGKVQFTYVDAQIVDPIWLRALADPTWIR